MYYGKVITFWIKKQYNTSKILWFVMLFHIFSCFREKSFTSRFYLYTHTHREISSHNHSETAQWSGSPQDVFSSPLSYQNKHEWVVLQNYKTNYKTKTYSNYFLDFQQVVEDHVAELNLLLPVRDFAIKILQMSHRRTLFLKLNKLKLNLILVLF